jgi:hypothetical protein
MKYRTLGSSGLAVSKLALGTMYFGSQNTEEGAFALLDAFLEAGGRDAHTPVEETPSFLDDAIRAGKIHYAGLSNFTGWQLQLTVSTAKTMGVHVPTARVRECGRTANPRVFARPLMRRPAASSRLRNARAGSAMAPTPADPARSHNPSEERKFVMAKSNGRSSFGKSSSGRSSFGRRGWNVTLIEDGVQRSYARTAKVAFCVVAVTVGPLAATVAADKWHPIIALIVGGAIGTAVAFVVVGFIVARGRFAWRRTVT